MAGSQPWVDAVKTRPDITLVEVTLDNRQELPELVWRWLQFPNGHWILLRVFPIVAGTLIWFAWLNT